LESYSRPLDVTVSADGRFAFARYWDHEVRWWDTNTQQRCGQVTDAFEAAYLDAQGVVVTRSIKFGSGLARDDHRFSFWDAAPGQLPGESAPVSDIPETNPVRQIVTTNCGRHFVATLDPDYGRAPGDRPAGNWAYLRGRSLEPERGHSEVLLMDAVDRRFL